MTIKMIKLLILKLPQSPDPVRSIPIVKTAKAWKVDHGHSFLYQVFPRQEVPKRGCIVELPGELRQNLDALLTLSLIKYLG